MGETTEAAILGTSIALLAGLVICVQTWLVMLCIGAAHSHEASVPAWGFLGTLWLVVGANVLLASGRAGRE
jgi:hypothetical protein